MCGSNVRRKGQGTQGRHAVGEEAPAQETHENCFPIPIQLRGSRCVICPRNFNRKLLTLHKQS